MRLLSYFKKLSLKKKLLFIVIGLIIVFFGFKTLTNASAQNKYILEKVERNDIVEIITETGTVNVHGRTEIYSPGNGIVENLYVKNGDAVTKGQELLTIQSTATEQEKSQALAQYLTAKNSLDTAQATMHSLQAIMFSEWDSFKTLAETDKYEEADGKPKTDKRTLPEFMVAEREWLAAESNYKKQQAVISQAQAAVNSTFLLYQATQNATVKATIDGTVSNLSVAEGSNVSIKTTAPIPLLIIADTSTIEIVVSFSENDISKIRAEQEVTIDVNAIHDKEYKGIVRRVDAIGTSVQGVMRYGVYIEIIDGDQQLRSGMKAEVDIVTNKVTNVLAVSNAVIKPYKGGRAVRIPDPKTNEITYLPVMVGIRGKEKTQILEGVTEGQSVIVTLSNEQIKRPGLFGN